MGPQELSQFSRSELEEGIRGLNEMKKQILASGHALPQQISAINEGISELQAQLDSHPPAGASGGAGGSKRQETTPSKPLEVIPEETQLPSTDSFVETQLVCKK